MRSISDYSNSEKELQQLEELRTGVAQEMAEKKRMKEAANEQNQGKNRGYSSRQSIGIKDRFNQILKGSQIGSGLVFSGKYRKEDTVYMIVLIVSILGDIGTAISGSIEAIPGVGLIFGLVAGMVTRLFVIMISITIAFLYLMNGHYKRKKAFAKIAVLMGFSFLELMPIATALPGFIGSFIINYIIVIQVRLAEKITKNKIVASVSKAVIVKDKIARLRRVNYDNRAKGLQNEVADDYNHYREEAA